MVYFHSAPLCVGLILEIEVLKGSIWFSRSNKRWPSRQCLRYR